MLNSDGRDSFIRNIQERSDHDIPNLSLLFVFVYTQVVAQILTSFSLYLV